MILWKETHVAATEGEEVSFLVPSNTSGEAPSNGAASAPGPAAGAAAETPAPETGIAEVPAEGTQQEAPEVNLARLLAYVDYRVRLLPDGRVDPQAAFTYSFRQSDIRRHMKELSYRALSRIAASQDFLRWIAQDRKATSERLKTMIQQAVDREGLGLEVTFVGIPAVHPPAPTAMGYERVVAMMERKEALRYEGETQADKVLQQAAADSATMVNAATGAAVRLTMNTEASKDQFLKQLDAYQRAPLVYMFRTYFDAIEKVLQGQKVYLLPETKDEVIIIDSKEKLTPELLKLNPGGE